MSIEKEPVKFKGTRQGILLSIAEEEPFSKAMECIQQKFEQNMNFFVGSPISVDLGWREIEAEDLDELLNFFKEKGVRMLGVISTSLNTRKLCENKGLKVIIGRLGLADHHGRQKLERKPRPAPGSAAAMEEPESTPTLEIKNRLDSRLQGETVMIKKTIRSGQALEYPGNVVIMGDVNPGAEVKAGGDVIILGALRGVASAGIGSDGQNAVIIALKFQPTQLRLGNQMTNRFDGKFLRSKQPVIARLKNDAIELTIYN